MKQLDHRRRLIDGFVNSIYLFDDYLVITFNYKEETKQITFAEIEEAFGSDLLSLTLPNKRTPSQRLGVLLFRCGLAVRTRQPQSGGRGKLVVFALQNAVVDRKTNLLRSEAEYGILLPLPKILHESAGFLLFHF